jgi:hypothetical protein
VKRLLFLSFVLLVPSAAFAFGGLKKDRNGIPIQGHAPTTFYVYSSTKANISHSTATVPSVGFKSSAAVNWRLNGAGVAYPVTADTDYVYVAPAGVTSIVFGVASSATKTKLYITD